MEKKRKRLSADTVAAEVHRSVTDTLNKRLSGYWFNSGPILGRELQRTTIQMAFHVEMVLRESIDPPLLTSIDEYPWKTKS